jgi:VWFA-related protein
MKSAVAAVLLASATLIVLEAAPQQRTPFRGTSEVVAVYATVMDKTTGRLMTDLPKEAFMVFDNGKRQEITVFSNETQPITVVIMLDRSGSMMPFADIVRRAAERFVEKMQAEDKARVGDFSHQVQILPEQFTGDQKQLLWNLRTNLQSARNGPSPVWYAVDRSMTALSPEGGRRVVLMLSDGHDDPSYGQPRTTFKELQQRVVEEEMMIYAVGVPASLQNNWGVTFNRSSPMIGMKFQPPDPDLRKIAEQSGGGYFELDWRDDLDATFERVADELHRQYLLGFVPAALDGKTHTIDVRVNNRDAKVRARKNYLATTKR